LCLAIVLRHVNFLLSAICFDFEYLIGNFNTSFLHPYEK
jgi:hypothetical protein